MSKIWDALQKVESTAGGSLPEFAALGPQVGSVPEGNGSSGQDRGGSHGKREGERDEVSIGEVQVERYDRIDYHTNPASAGADKFRLLRMRLNGFWSAGNLKTLLVTSPLPEDGKTTVTLNLACALNEHRAKRVLVIDADLHQRSVGARLGLSPDAGLAECLQDGVYPQSVIKRVEPLGWYLLSAGKRDLRNPTELFRPSELRGNLQELLPHFDWILIDSPPVLPLVDALTISQAVDGTLLVARAGQTPNKAVEDTIELLGRKRIVGLVLNGVEKSNQPYAKYQNYYRSKKFHVGDGEDQVK